MRKCVQKKKVHNFLTRKEHLKLIKLFLDPLLLPLKLEAVPLNHEGGYNFLDAFEYDALSWLAGKNYFRKVNTAKKNKRNMK